jgi:hypothetical protein
MERSASAPRFAPPSPPGSLELVSLGEHLIQTAGLLDQARTDTELDLRLYRLIGTLRSAAAPHTDPIAAAHAVLARASREAVAAGAVRTRRTEFAAILRDAGELLRTAGASPDRMYLSRRILDVAHRVDLLRAEPTRPPEPAPATEAVPIEALEPAASGAPLSSFEAGLASYQRRVRDEGLGEPSLEGLRGETVVSIESLCYSGRAALERAAELRTLIGARIAKGEMEEARPLVQELLDLVPLALDAAH